MTFKAADIRTYAFRKEDRLLLDANIWLSIYGPIASQDERTVIYSKALRQIFSSKCTVLLDVAVLAEYINRFAKLEYEQLEDNIRPNTFKDFRVSAMFRAVAAEVAINVKSILKNTTCCNFDFESINIDSLLSDYQSGVLDFNDSLIVELCKAQDLKLITHDKDFKNCDIPVLTAHRKLLQ